MNTCRSDVVAVAIVYALLVVGAGAMAMGTSSGAGAWHKADPKVLAGIREPIGAPCGGLVARLRVSTDPQSLAAGPLPLEPEIVNVSAEPITVHAGVFGDFMPALLLFDTAGRVLWPADLKTTLGHVGYSGPGGPTQPRELKPGEALTAWEGLSLYSPCNELGLEPGTYRAQVLLFSLPAGPRQGLPRILISNVLTFQWPGATK